MLDISTMSIRTRAWYLARAIVVNPSEGAVRLLLQLFGAAPCDGCGYIKSGCRCNPKRKIPRRHWTDFCRADRAERSARMERLR